MKNEFRILALEPDPTRAENLRRLIRERVDADVFVAFSSSAAIASLSHRVPDLVLTSALAPPLEDERLLSHLKQLGDAQDLPILTVPPVVHDEPPPGRRPAFAFLKRQRRPLFPSYDREVVGKRIAEAVDRARARAVNRVRDARLRELVAPAPAVIEQPPQQVISAAATPVVLSRAILEHRERAERLRAADVPWLGGVETLWGLKLQLLNISATGLLVESASKLLPDSFSELRLFGTDKSLLVPARLVRCEVGEVTHLGVKYHTAAVFEHELQLIDRRQPLTGSSTPKALAELLMRVTSGVGFARRADEARATFERGLLELVRARRIQIRPRPEAPSDGGEAVYFTVPTGNASPPVLQVTFEPDYQPAWEELTLLKAAASVAAVVLQYEGSAPSLVSCNAW
jgi:hypothetical protein